MINMIKRALISVSNKDGIVDFAKELDNLGVEILSTGGTAKTLKDSGVKVKDVSDYTGFPEMMEGRVKTLHPKVFGGILNRQNNESDVAEMQEFTIPQIDLVIVDLYPFEQTVASKAPAQDIIEKIDIGGISLIRAAAKNHKDVVILSSKNQYNDLLALLETQNGATTFENRRRFAAEAFAVFVLSAVLRENQFRHVALAGLGVCLVRLVLIDMAEANLALRGLVFIGVGLLMLGMNAIYNRYRVRFQ